MIKGCVLGVSGGFKRGLFYANFYADFYANFTANSLFWLKFYWNFHVNFKGMLFILPHNIYNIKRNPRLAVHLQCSTNGLFINKCTNDCLVTTLRSLLTRHRKTIKDQRLHIYLFWVKFRSNFAKYEVLVLAYWVLGLT